MAENENLMTHESVYFGDRLRHDPTIPMEARAKRIATRICNAIKEYGPKAAHIEVDQLHIELGQYSRVSIFCQPGVLKSPFHKGMEITGYLRAGARITTKDLWKSYGRLIAELMTEPGLASAKMRELVDGAEKRTTGTGMKLLSYRPVEYISLSNERSLLTVELSYGMISDSLQDITGIFPITSAVGSPYSYLNVQARAQKTRMARKSNGYEVDSVLHAALSQMTELSKRTLIDFAENNAQDHWDACGDWTRDQLRARKIILPEAVETLQFKNGQINGRVRLADNISFNRNRALISGNLPDAYLMQASKKPAREILDHPWIDPAIQITKCTNQTKRTAIVMDVPLLPLRTI